MRTFNVHCILYSSVPAGTEVHLQQANGELYTVRLTENKKWSDKVFAGIVIAGHSDLKSAQTFCADIFYSFKEYPCSDASLPSSH